MKIRAGFVSNSSSSSFCIYGAEIDEDVLIKKLGLEEGEDTGIFEIEEIIEKLELNLSVEFPPYCGIHLGRHWCSIEDNETGAEFKASVEATLQKLMGKKVKCSTIEYAWRDG